MNEDWLGEETTIPDDEGPLPRGKIVRVIPEKRIMAAAVCDLCGGISTMTLWRWGKRLDFPRPIYIGRRRYWRESEVVEWLNGQAT